MTTIEFSCRLFSCPSVIRPRWSKRISIVFKQQPDKHLHRSLLVSYFEQLQDRSMTATMTKAKTSKQISCKVRMLDDQELPFHIDVSRTGRRNRESKSESEGEKRLASVVQIFRSSSNTINCDRWFVFTASKNNIRLKSFTNAISLFAMAFREMIEVNCFLHQQRTHTSIIRRSTRLREWRRGWWWHSALFARAREQPTTRTSLICIYSLGPCAWMIQENHYKHCSPSFSQKQLDKIYLPLFVTTLIYSKMIILHWNISIVTGMRFVSMIQRSIRCRCSLSSVGWKWINPFSNKSPRRNSPFVLNFILPIQDNWKKNSLGKTVVSLQVDIGSARLHLGTNLHYKSNEICSRVHYYVVTILQLFWRRTLFRVRDEALKSNRIAGIDVFSYF